VLSPPLSFLSYRRFYGDIVRAAHGCDIEEFRQRNEKVHEIPFNSSNKWQMSIHKMSASEGTNVLFLKGAPDVLLTKCSFYLDADGVVRPIDDVFTRLYTERYELFGGNVWKIMLLE
jgi:sodium/potassium-transporting ATPase subunit alpha